MYTTYETTELIGLMRASMIDKIAVILEREILAGEYQAGDLFSTENYPFMIRLQNIRLFSYCYACS